MRRLKTNNRCYYYLEGINGDALAQIMVQYMKEGKFVRNPSFDKELEGAVPKIVPFAPRHMGHLAIKFDYLIHMLCYRQVSQGSNCAFAINARLLQSVIGVDYWMMLRTLFLQGIINTDGRYYPKRMAQQYSIVATEKIKTKYSGDNRLRRLAEKLDKEQEKYRRRTKIQVRQKLDYDFFERYQHSLSKIKVSYGKEMAEIISQHPLLSKLARLYYEQKSRAISTETCEITSVDDNGRIYSPLTNLPKLIKPFLKVKHTLDISNSHPLLFCLCIFSSYRIESSLAKDISICLSTPSPLLSPLHYDIGFDYNSFVYKQLKKTFPIPRDALKYIHLTSTGQLWNYMLNCIQNEDKTILRSDIKKALFAEVFYSTNPTMNGKSYAPIFEREFPTVYRLINKIRREYPKGALPNILMKQESKLITAVLTELYDRGCLGVNIHDEIVVLDVSKNKQCTVEEVTAIIEEVYLQHGLHPTCKVQQYSPEYVEQYIDEKLAEYSKIRAKFAEIKQKADNGDKKAQDIMRQLAQGSLELCYSDDKTEIIIHIRD